jgi:hypothetical protein
MAGLVPAIPIHDTRRMRQFYVYILASRPGGAIYVGVRAVCLSIGKNWHRVTQNAMASASWFILNPTIPRRRRFSEKRT